MYFIYHALTTPVYNLLMLAVDRLALRWLCSNPTLAHAIAMAVAAGAAALVAARMLGEDAFDCLRLLASIHCL